MLPFQTKLINIKHLAEKSGISYTRLHMRRNGRTLTPLNLADRTKLANAITAELDTIFRELGFEISLKKIN